MKLGFAVLVLMATSGGALAHGYRLGNLEIVHPSIMVPSATSDCSCAHVKITNHGKTAEYFLGAKIAAAARTHLIQISTTGQGLTTPMRVAIPAGATLDLARNQWCLFMSGITTHLEADMGSVAGQLLFERQGPVDIEFMIDDSGH